MGNQVIFDEEESVISNNISKEVFLMSKRKGDMSTLDVKLIGVLPSICLLLNASSNLSWLWR